MQAFANNHFVCFSSQNLPYSGASDFVYGVLRTPSQGSSPYNSKNKNSEVDIYLLRYFGTLEGTLVETHSVFKQFCRAKS